MHTFSEGLVKYADYLYSTSIADTSCSLSDFSGRSERMAAGSRGPGFSVWPSSWCSLCVFSSTEPKDSALSSVEQTGDAD